MVLHVGDAALGSVGGQEPRLDGLADQPERPDHPRTPRAPDRVRVAVVHDGCRTPTLGHRKDRCLAQVVRPADVQLRAQLQQDLVCVQDVAVRIFEQDPSSDEHRLGKVVPGELVVDDWGDEVPGALRADNVEQVRAPVSASEVHQRR